MEWPRPKNKKDLQVFLGFANFYRNQLASYSIKLQGLHGLLKKDVAWTWTDEHDQTFQEIKQAFKGAKIRRHYNPDLPTVVETDASNFAMAAILSQKDQEGEPHSVAFFSRSFSAAAPEQNYEIHDKELLAIVEAFKKWRMYLEGAQHTITVYTDHQNLLYFTTTKQLNQ